jgi:hypothetical protein
VGGFVTQDGVIGLAHRRQRERVGGGAVEDEEHLARGLEQLSNQVGGPARPGIVPVAAGVAGVGLLQGRPRFRADAGVVVAGELAATSGDVTHKTLSAPTREDDGRTFGSLPQRPSKEAMIN